MHLVFRPTSHVRILISLTQPHLSAIFIHTAIISKSQETPSMAAENEEIDVVRLDLINEIDRTEEVSIVLYAWSVLRNSWWDIDWASKFAESEVSVNKRQQRREEAAPNRSVLIMTHLKIAAEANGGHSIDYFYMRLCFLLRVRPASLTCIIWPKYLRLTKSIHCFFCQHILH